MILAAHATRLKTGSLPRSRSVTQEVHTNETKGKGGSGIGIVKLAKKKTTKPTPALMKPVGDPFPNLSFIGDGFPPGAFPSIGGSRSLNDSDGSEGDDGGGEEDDDDVEYDSDASSGDEELTTEAAALLLMSVSPHLSAARPRALSHLEPLESLAALSSFRKKGAMGSLRDFHSDRGASMASLSVFISSNKRTRENDDFGGKKSKRSKQAAESKASKINPECPKDLRPKYGSLYNTGGRVGIYTPKERSAIIARYRDKRRRRVWTKKVRYNCRKNLADNRLRIKGRFVKKDSEEARAYFAAQAAAKAKLAAEAKKSPINGTKVIDALLTQSVQTMQAANAKRISRPRAFSSTF